MAARSVEISLGTDELELGDLFGYSAEAKASGLYLSDVIGHWFNQTLRRDNFYGAWAQTWYPDSDKGVSDFGVKLTSPSGDLSPYAEAVPRFLAAGRVGLRTWRSLSNPPSDIVFQLPLGLSMARTRALQLLHYPPVSVRQYMDYLYSPTNRRCESLLAVYGYPGPEQAFTETIMDLVPIAAGGGDSGSSEIEAYNSDFVEYDKHMLAAMIRDPFMPIVGYGTPVRQWIETNFWIPSVQVNQLVRLPLVDGGPPVAVLAANHPSKYLYDTDEHDPEDSAKVLTQDLITAGWLAETSLDWTKDKDAVLARQTAYWTSVDGQARMMSIRESQDTEFSYNH